MRQKPEALSEAAEKTVRDRKRAPRRHFSAKEQIRIVIGQHRRPAPQGRYPTEPLEGVPEAGKKQLAGDAVREATSDKVKTQRGGGPSAEGSAGRGDLGEPPARKALSGMGSSIHEIPRFLEAGRSAWPAERGTAARGG